MRKQFKEMIDGTKLYVDELFAKITAHYLFDVLESEE